MTIIELTLSDDDEANQVVEALKQDQVRIVYRPLGDDPGWKEMWPEVNSLVFVEIRSAV